MIMVTVQLSGGKHTMSRGSGGHRPDDKWDASEWALLRTFLAGPNIDMTPQQINEAIGQTPGNKTREETRLEFADWIRGRTG